MALDKYSDHRIPFMVGTWARAHKFNPTAVNLSKALEDIDKTRAAIVAKEKELEDKEAHLRALIADAEKRMEALNGI